MKNQENIKNLMSKSSMKVKTLIIISMIFVFSAPCYALVINFNDVTSGGMSQTALNAFNEAGSIWEGVFLDPVTVNVNISFKDLGSPTTLGQTGSTSLGFEYSDIYDSLITEAASSFGSASDVIAASNLQTGPGLNFQINGPDENGFMNTLADSVFDNNNTRNNDTLRVTSANAKALGLVDPDAGVDAIINFNSSFAFDFDSSDGISAGQFDFVGIAAHELGHSLGFVSGVDIVDFNALPNGGNTPVFHSAFDDVPLFSVLDLYRYSNSTGTGIPDFTVGGTSFFSIDGGNTEIGQFSTGAFNGDGRQASHWKDHLGLGIMDPTVGRGEFLTVSSNDLLAFDVIGWDTVQPVPEPSTFAILGIGLGAIGFFYRRNMKKINKDMEL